MQYAVKRGCRVVAVDLEPIDPVPGALPLQGDFLDPAIQSELRERLDGPADTVPSDMAAHATGRRLVVEVSTRSDGQSDLAVGDQAEAVARACSPICFSRAVGAASRKVCIGVLP